MPRPDQWSPFRGDVPGPPAESPRYIPGTKALIPRPRAEEPEWVEDPRWSREYNVETDEGEQRIRLYTIGALAAALGKQPHTIRKWIRNGIIPDSGLKTQALDGTLGDAGRRLWTKEQIDSVVLIAHDEGVIGGKRRRNFNETNFPRRVRTLWEQRNW